MAVGIVFLLLIAYAVVVAMPSWRWLLAYVAVVGILLTVWLVSFMNVPWRTGLEVIGLLYFVPIAVSTVAGALVRAVTLAMASRGRSGVVAINVAGVAIPLAFLVAVIVWANR
jgi:hypothetical protein